MKKKQIAQSQELKGSQSVKNLNKNGNPSSVTAKQEVSPYLSSILKNNDPSFILKSSEIPEMSRTINFERLLSIPKHKPIRMKFDKNQSKCLVEQENNPETMEDQFKLFDKPWISSLRFMDPTQLQQMSSLKMQNTVPDNPPTFYEQDIQKWHLKFEKSQKDRSKMKSLMMKTHEFNLTTKNSNFEKTNIKLPQRRYSRQSNENFNIVDFNYIGNTGEFNHLIHKKIGGVSPHPAELDFEMNLRNYKSNCDFNGSQPWIYPKTKIFKAVVTDKGVFPAIGKIIREGDYEEGEGVSSKKLKNKESKFYNDVFRERNMQKVRHSLMKKDNIALKSLQWEADLRHYHPDRLEVKKEEGQTPIATKKK